MEDLLKTKFSISIKTLQIKCTCILYHKLRSWTSWW